MRNKLELIFPGTISKISVLLLALLLVTSIAQAQGKIKRDKIRPLTDADFPSINSAKIELGKLLFFDKILSGNKNTSCATCHHPLAATGDGLSLSAGEGGQGLGITRDAGDIYERVPRNAPHVYNLGAKQFTTMFHDGRVMSNDEDPTEIYTPAGTFTDLDNPLAAQAMFPPTSGTEMAGQPGENRIANAAAKPNNEKKVWSLLTRRVMKIKAYRKAFKKVYPGTKISFVHIANSIGAFEAAAFRADNSPFDRFLRGEKSAMSKNAKIGWRLFKGKANCISCHSGVFLTDQDFHAIGIPQIGPGKGDGPSGFDDYGREQVTGDDDDRYKFRTPTLRNVALTGPWGHDGAYNTLEGIVRHHLDAVQAFEEYDLNQAVLPSRVDLDDLDEEAYELLNKEDKERIEAFVDAIEIEPVYLSDREVQFVIDFLHALTDPASLDLRWTVPKSVPSGLPIAD